MVYPFGRSDFKTHRTEDWNVCFNGGKPLSSAYVLVMLWIFHAFGYNPFGWIDVNLSLFLHYCCMCSVYLFELFTFIVIQLFSIVGLMPRFHCALTCGVCV